MDIVEEHAAERDILLDLELNCLYRINNPLLIAQRNKVRKLKDKIIFLEEERKYTRTVRPCAFRKCLVVDGKNTYNPNCAKTVCYSLRDWISYGNCCRSCNDILNKDVPELISAFSKSP